jgi:predicted transposase/invertase (TIGR01784 family)
MSKEFLSPLMDDVFKYIFADPRNIDNLRGLLIPIVGLPKEEFRDLTIMNPLLNRFFRKDKQGILDIKVHTTSGKVINVEVQVCRFAAIRKRLLFYASKLLWEQIKQGEDYDTIRQVISVVICDHLLPDEGEKEGGGEAPGRNYLNVYTFRNERDGKQFTDLIKIITIELPKVPNEPDQEAVWPWLRFFTCRNEEEFTMLAEQYPEVKQPVAILKKLSWGERRRMIAENKEKWRRDVRAMTKDAREEGIKIGSEERMREIGRKLKEMGLPTAQIAVATGLAPEDIEAL